MQNFSHENEFNLRENELVGETHFNKNGFALRLVLTQRQTRTGNGLFYQSSGVCEARQPRSQGFSVLCRRRAVTVTLEEGKSPGNEVVRLGAFFLLFAPHFVLMKPVVEPIDLARPCVNIIYENNNNYVKLHVLFFQFISFS